MAVRVHFQILAVWPASNIVGDIPGSAFAWISTCVRKKRQRHSDSFKGSFMKSSSDDAAKMGCHFQLSGTDYKASGIFAAKK